MTDFEIIDGLSSAIMSIPDFAVHRFFVPNPHGLLVPVNNVLIENCNENTAMKDLYATLIRSDVAEAHVRTVGFVDCPRS